jgi:hypothetical protein
VRRERPLFDDLDPKPLAFDRGERGLVSTSWGTCDWGGCDEPSVALRFDDEDGEAISAQARAGRWLPVCRAHVDPDERRNRPLYDAEVE